MTDQTLQDITELLADVNLDIILVLHGLDVAPLPGQDPGSGGIRRRGSSLHSLWPRHAALPADAPGGGPSTAYGARGGGAFDYDADPSRLPSGAIELARVAIAYPPPLPPPSCIFDYASPALYLSRGIAVHGDVSCAVLKR